MSDISPLNVPKEDVEIVKGYLSFSKEKNDEFINVLNQIPLGLSNSSIFDFVKKEIKLQTADELSKTLKFYFSLKNTKDSSELDVEEFLDLFLYSLNHNSTIVENVQEAKNKLKDLFLSSNNEINSIIQDKYHFDDNLFLSSELSENLKPVFSHEGKYSCSVLTSSLRIEFRKNGKDKNILFTIDHNDVDNLIENLNKCKERLEVIRKELNSINVIEVK
nr:hypothetical protein [uncultured Sphingobacterium sp.]